MLPPCLVDTVNFQTTKTCNQVTAYTSDLKAYAMAAYTTMANTLTYIGIAKDGHFIVGPYQEDGTQFKCTQLDTCGGITLDNGEYISLIYLIYQIFGPILR